MRIRSWFLLLIFFLAIAIFLLFPLPKKGFEIKWEEAGMERKQRFLDSIHPQKPGDPLPNIVVILTDDLGVHDISFYGNRKVSTPNIDRLAQNGASFSQAYCASPVCSPARSALLTGRYPQRFGFEFQMHDRYLKNRLEYYGFKYLVRSDPWHPGAMSSVPSADDIHRQGLPPSEITIAELLKARGYATALVGKWHLGWDDQNKPCRFGFDEQYGFFDSHTLYAPEGTEGITDQKIKRDWTDKYMWNDGRNGPKGIYRNCNLIEEPEHLTDAITRESRAFMRTHRHGPFFLLAAYNAPHTPLQAPDRYVSLFLLEPDPVKRVYYAMIKHLDDAIGRLMEELSDLGLEENTLVIFMSDNGGAAYTLTTDNAPLRGGKITDFEGGLRVPLFMSWSGRIAPGQRFDHPVIAMDVYSTIAAATNCPLPADRTIDGMDLLTCLQNDSLPPHTHLYWQRGNSRAVRSENWKAIWNEASGDTLLYLITSDPYERHDLFSQEKEVARELIRVHQTWSQELPPPLWPPIVRFREEVDGRSFYFEN